MKIRNYLPLTLLITVVTMMPAGSASTAVPTTMNYQGRLTEDTGEPIADGDYSVTFTIYDAASAGDSKWSETQNVTTINGLFSTLLGSINPIIDTVFNGTTRYLGIYIGAEPEATPRVALVTVPFAFQASQAGSAETAVVADSADAVTDGSIDLNDIGQNGAAEGQIIKWMGSGWTLADESTGGTGWNWSDSSSYGPDTVGVAALLTLPSTLTTSIPSALMLLRNTGSGSALDVQAMGGAASITSVNAYAMGGSSFSRAIFAVANGDQGSKYGTYGQASGLGRNYGSYALAYGDELNYAFYGRAYGSGANYGVTSYAEDGNFNYAFYGEAGGSGENNYGLSVSASGAQHNYGVSAGVTSTDPSSSNFGAFITADGAGSNVGLYARAANGTTNRAGHFDGDVFVDGNSQFKGNLLISRTEPDNPLWEFDTQNHLMNFYEFGSDEDRRLMEFSAFTGGKLRLFHKADTSYDIARLSAGLNGGELTLKDIDGSTTIFFRGNSSAISNNDRVVLHEGSVDDLELMNEPGIAQSRISSCFTIASGSTMQDVVTVTIEIPAAGYISLIGHGLVELSGTVNAHRIKAQIDETAGGSYLNGYYSRIGLGAYGSALSSAFSDFDLNCHRTYYKDAAGSYTFRLEAHKETDFSAKICFASLTATYFPTSYGTVSTVAYNGDADSHRLGPDDPTPAYNPTAQTVDLRERELAEKQARREKTKAALEAVSSEEGMQ